MTDTEKLDLLLGKVGTLTDKINDIETELQDIKKDVNNVKRQIMKSTAELKAMDELTLDEIERVHEILHKHKADKTVHSA